MSDIDQEFSRVKAQYGEAPDNLAVTERRYRVGRSLGTTIYYGEQPQPCGWFPGDPDLAAEVVAHLNAERERVEQMLARGECPWCDEEHEGGETCADYA